MAGGTNEQCQRTPSRIQIQHNPLLPTSHIPSSPPHSLLRRRRRRWKRRSVGDRTWLGWRGLSSRSRFRGVSFRGFGCCDLWGESRARVGLRKSRLLFGIAGVCGACSCAELLVSSIAWLDSAFGGEFWLLGYLFVFLVLESFFFDRLIDLELCDRCVSCLRVWKLGVL